MLNNEELKGKLKQRKCLYCGKPIKQYLFGGIFIPFETTAQKSILICDRTEFPYSTYFVGENNPLSLCRIVLTSTCECGNISFWNCDKQTLWALLEDDMQKEGYFLEYLYHKDTIQQVMGKSNNEIYDKRFQQLIDLLPREEKK